MQGMIMTNYMNIGIGIFLSLVGFGIGKNINKQVDEDKIAQTIKEQLEGKLDANANAIASMNTSINMIKSEMITHDELQKKADSIISDIGGDTEKKLKKHMNKTNAKVDLISKTYRSLKTQIKKGFVKINDELKEDIPVPTDWDGLKKNDYQWCLDSPSLCEPFKLELGTHFLVDGDPVAIFKSKNLWDKDFQLDLNLLFKVTAITLRQDENKGAVRNQGIYIQAGYVESGKFITLAEDKLYNGDANLDSKLFYSPTMVHKPKTYDLFDPSFLMGSSYRYLGNEIGLTLGASLFNFRKAQFRIGGLSVIESSYLGFGASFSYHYLFGSKHLNVAPYGSYIWGINNDNDISLGLVFQVW